jgi:hypothetical protein
VYNRIAKFMLIISAIAPIGFVYGWVAFTEQYYWKAGIIVLVSMTLVAACLVLLTAAKKNLERFPFEPCTIEAADRENIAFMLLYLSPLFTSQFGAINLNVFIPTLLIFAMMTSTGYNYHVNPLLGLLGWHFYKVSSKEHVTYVLVTKKQLRNATQIENVGQLTEYILIDLGENYAR